MSCPPISGSCLPLLNPIFINTAETIANELVTELSDPNLTVPYCCHFIKANLGSINNSLFINIQLDGNLQFMPPINEITKDIIKLVFYHKYYIKQASSVLLNAGANHILQLKDGKSSVSFESAANLARAWKAQADEIKELLDERIDFFKRRACTASSTVGIPPWYGYAYGGGLEPILNPLPWGGGGSYY